MDETNDNQSTIPQNGGGAWSLIAVMVVLALVIIGALFFWQRADDDSLENEQLESINTQSDSDAVSDIEADLDATDIENVDYNLDEENFNAS
ncbi:MAG: hypothetical protein HYT69_02890 [Candidatus Zambryskibacteria bacterium]|nr:hypothetical protein [Candidatus Zambryskibacteria bacterium]